MNANPILTAIIVEDESKSAAVLQYLIKEYCPGMTVTATATDISSAVAAIIKMQPDLLFLDVEIGNGTAFELLERLLPAQFRTIFTTAYDHYALPALKQQAVDYLLKPIRPEELVKAVHKVQARAPGLYTGGGPGRLTIPVPGGMLFLNTDDICYCKADRSYTHLHLSGQSGSIVASRNINAFSPLLPDRFFRVHHSYIVNINYIVKYIQGRGGYVIMSDGTEIEVAARKKQEFLQLFR